MKNIYLKHIDTSNAIVPALAVAHDWDEANRFIENGYTRIGRAAWREYKRVQREENAESINRQLALVREHDAESIAERERLVSEEPYL